MGEKSTNLDKNNIKEDPFAAILDYLEEYQKDCQPRSLNDSGE